MSHTGSLQEGHDPADLELAMAFSVYKPIQAPLEKEI